MASYELQWKENLQAYVYTPQTYGGRAGAVTGNQIIIREEDLPADAKVINYDKELDKPVTIKVSKSFLDSKKKVDKTSPSTIDEYRKAQQDALKSLPDGSPLSPTQFQINISRADVLNEKDVFLDQGLVVYVDPNNKNGGKQSIVIKPGNRPGAATENNFVAVSAEKEIQDIYYAAARKQGGIKELKDKLYYGGFYKAAGMSDQDTSRSLALGDAADVQVQAALQMALQTQTTQNWSLIKGGKKPLELDTWLQEGKAAFLGTNADKTINLPNEVDAKKRATTAFQRFTGRNPNDNEIMAVLAAINDAAAQNPSIQTTDLSKYPNTTISQQGFNDTELNQFVEDYAKSQPGAEEWAQGQGGFETFNGAINILLNELGAQGARRVAPGGK